MADVYRRLARRLDRLPHGFPSTEDGLEILILKKIFTPEAASVATRLRPFPETAERIARRFGQPVPAMRARLDAMADRGQIASMTMGGEQRYALVPFIVGIYEFQLAHIDRELAGLVEAYLPRLAPVLGGNKPALARVVPVTRSIDARLHILRYDDLRALIDEARAFSVRDCICRKKSALEGHPCRHMLESCLAMSSEPHGFDYFNYAGRVISKEEAIALLDRTEEEGLVHATYNVQQRPMFVCNCCSCCCGFLRGLSEFKAPYMIARSPFVASIDAGACTACGVCASDRCPVQAIAGHTGTYAVAGDRCIGCGVCAVACPAEAIRLVAREEPSRAEPPTDIVRWSVERMSSRSGPLTRMMLRLWLATHQRRAVQGRGTEGRARAGGAGPLAQ